MLDNTIFSYGVLAKTFVKLASKSTHPKHRHVALIFHEGILLAWSNNSREFHAEARAIEIAKILRYKTNLTLISIAITKGGKLKLGKPCIKCQQKISRAKIKNVYYSTKEQMIVKWNSGG